MRRLLQWSIEANGLVAAGLAAPFVARSSSLEIGARIVTSDTRSRVAHHSTTHSTSDME